MILVQCQDTSVSACGNFFCQFIVGAEKATLLVSFLVGASKQARLLQWLCMFYLIFVAATIPILLLRAVGALGSLIGGTSA